MYSVFEESCCACCDTLQFYSNSMVYYKSPRTRGDTQTHTPVSNCHTHTHLSKNCHLLCLFEGEGDVVLSLSPQSWIPSWETRSVTLLVSVDHVQL